jgi:hypothetical protein
VIKSNSDLFSIIKENLFFFHFVLAKENYILIEYLINSFNQLDACLNNKCDTIQASKKINPTTI